MVVIFFRAVPLDFAGGGGCEQVNLSLSEESPAFPDMMEDAGPIEQLCCIKMEDANNIEHIYCIETEDAGLIEQMNVIKSEDVASIEQKYPLIKTEEESVSVEQDHHSVQTEEASSVEQELNFVTIEDAASAEEDITMEVKSFETYFKTPEEVCIL